MNLNIGAGLDIREGYINCDIRLFPRIDMFCDARKLPLKNESCKEILAIDILNILHTPKLLSILSMYSQSLLCQGVLKYLLLKSLYRIHF